MICFTFNGSHSFLTDKIIPLSTAFYTAMPSCYKAVDVDLKILATIKRSFKYLTEKTFSLLYKSLVCPHLEYCNAVWNMHFVKNVKEIEAVQRWATKLMPLLKSLPYDDRLKRLNLPTSEFTSICFPRTQHYKHIKDLMEILYNSIYKIKI